MNRAARRSPEFREKFAAYQASQPKVLTQVPREKWPAQQPGAVAIEVWRSQKWLVILYLEKSDCVRMTVNRAELDNRGKWAAEITWDELQQLKREIGRGETWMVECYPPDSKVVNVANMRHLWLLESQPAYGWH